MGSPKLCTTRLLDQNFGLCINPEDMILPFYHFHGTNYFRPWKLCMESANKDCGSNIDIAKDKFTITLDVQHFRPNEVNVKVTEEEIIIEGRHEDRQDNHGFISRQFTRRYALPRDCRPETVTSTLSSDGVLTIMGNKKIAKDIKSLDKMVPIKICGPCPKGESKINTALTFKNGTDSKAQLVDKEESQVTLKDDHCRLMKPELLKGPISGTEKLLSESRKETDELLKLISSEIPAQVITNNMTSDKLDDVLGQCKTAIAELTEKINETSSMTGSSEMSSLKSSMMSETFESQEMSSMSKSSMSMSSTISSIKTSEKASELLMCAELKEAAEII